METRRTATIVGLSAMFVAAVPGLVFDLRGNIFYGTVLIVTMLVAGLSAVAMVFQQLFSKCPMCGYRYFSIIFPVYLFQRRCCNCGRQEPY